MPQVSITGLKDSYSFDTEKYRITDEYKLFHGTRLSDGHDVLIKVLYNDIDETRMAVINNNWSNYKELSRVEEVTESNGIWHIIEMDHSPVLSIKNIRGDTAAISRTTVLGIIHSWFRTKLPSLYLKYIDSLILYNSGKLVIDDIVFKASDRKVTDQGRPNDLLRLIFYILTGYMPSGVLDIKRNVNLLHSDYQAIFNSALSNKAQMITEKDFINQFDNKNNIDFTLYALIALCVILFLLMSYQIIFL